MGVQYILLTFEFVLTLLYHNFISFKFIYLFIFFKSRVELTQWKLKYGDGDGDDI